MAVIFTMLDGLRSDAISEQRTPALYGLMQRSAYTLTAQSVVPSITLPCHLSIFHSMPPAQHGVLDNDFQPMARPTKGLVKHLRDHDLRSGFFHNWDVLRDITRPGELYTSFFIDTGYDLDGDSIVLEKAIASFGDFSLDFTFVYFASIDTAGHTFGWMSEGYLEQVKLVDSLVAQLLAAMPADRDLILQADHGGHEHTHGTELPEDMTIPWMLAGPKAKTGHKIKQAVTLLDTAPTICALLDIPPHKNWNGSIITDALRD